jgi:hypothetical protein
MRTSTRIAGIVSGLALTAGLATGIPVAASGAESSTPAPCAQQQRQVDKAEDALARATANFAQVKRSAVKPTKTDKVAKTVKVAKAKKAKKAQVQRLLKAQARLDGCLAEQPAPAAAATPLS